MSKKKKNDENIRKKVQDYLNGDEPIDYESKDFEEIVAELRTYQKELIESREKFESYIESSPTPIFISDGKGRFTYANNAACRLYGYTSSEITKLGITDLDPDDDALEIFGKMQTKGEIKNIERRVRHRDGQLIDIILDAVKISDDEYVAFSIEITKLKETERALKESEGNFRSLFSNMNEGFAVHKIITDEKNEPVDYLFLDVNPAFEKLTGLLRRDVIGKRVTEIIPGIPDENAGWIKRYGEVAQTGKSIVFEDYSESVGKWFTVSAYSPKPNQFAVTISDITNRKNAEQALRESEKKFRSLFENMNEGFALRKVLRDENGEVNDYIYLDVNPSYEKITGFKREELIGKKFTEITKRNNAKNLKFTKQYIEVATTGKSMVFEDYSETLKKWYLISAYSPLKDRFAVVVTDITERRTANQKIRESEEKLRIINENSTVGIALSDAKGNNVLVNQAFCDMLGYTEEELYRLNFSHFTHPNDYEQEAQLFKEILGGNRDSYKIEKRYVRKNGSFVWVFANIGVVKDERGNITNFVGVIENITERKRVEAALIESQRLGAIGEMSSAIAHDFNNSLQLIFGNLELALMNTDEDDPSRKYLKVIETATADAAARVQMLQRFGGKSQIPVKYDKIDVEEMINDVIMQSRPLWRDSARKEGLYINIQSNIQRGIYTYGNIGELRSVIYNIVKNGTEAMPEGGEITITGGTDDSKVFIRIKDNGRGMDDETQRRVFQPFFSTKGYELGRGMGLSSAYSIINEHKGNIFIAESRLGKGTTVEINLPLYDETTGELPKKTEPEIDRSKNVKILWVDDDRMIRDLANDVIKMLNLEGDVVADGEEAIKQLEKDEYDLVISDIGMPNMNGWELAKHIHERFDSKIRMGLVTGWGDQIDEAKIATHHVDFVITKPISLKQIEKIIFKKD